MASSSVGNHLLSLRSKLYSMFSDVFFFCDMSIRYENDDWRFPVAISSRVIGVRTFHAMVHDHSTINQHSVSNIAAKYNTTISCDVMRYFFCDTIQFPTLALSHAIYPP